MKEQSQGLPYIAKDRSSSKENKLAKRLYKNSSLKKLNTTTEFSLLRSINPDSSILGNSLINKSSSKNLLIPSISLKRSKQYNSSQKSLQISQGKILVTKPQYSFLHYKGDLAFANKKSQSGSPKTLLKKFTKFDFSTDQKILPDQLLQNYNDSIIQHKLPRSESKKSTQLLKNLKKKVFESVDKQENLTPDDFIQLIQEDGTITNQFCYLKKMNHPYDLKIIQFQGKMSSNLNKKLPQGTAFQGLDQYITISSRGVTYFNKDNSRFVPLQKWKKQAFYFNKLMNLEFFSKFRLFKNFAKWKKYIRKTAMKSMTDKLKNQLLLNDKYLRNALLQTRNLCFTMQNQINYCKFDDCENVMPFTKFKSCQDQFIQNQFEKRVNDIEEEIKQNLLSNLVISMKQFKEQNKISTSGQGKGVPLLIGDQKNMEMPYTKEATLRIQQQKFKKFLKLVQFITISSKINMMTQSTQNTVRKIRQQNQSYKSQTLESNYKLVFKGKQYIQCHLSLDMEYQAIFLRPTRDQLNYMFEDIVNKSIIKLCRNHKRIINDDDVLQIIYDGNDKIIKQNQTNILKLIITADDRQDKIVKMLNDAINASYSFIQKYSNKFNYLVDMHFENLKKLERIQEFTAKNHQDIKISLENWKNQLNQISSLSQQHQSAIFLLNFKQFKDKAKQCVVSCLQKMKKIIPQIFQNSTSCLLEQLQESLKKIETKPIGIESYIIFTNYKNQISNNLEDYADKLAQLNCIWIIMKSNASTNAEMIIIAKQERQINKLQTILNTLRTKIQESQMNTKVFQTRAQEEVKEMIPKIKQNIYKLYTQIKGQKNDVSSNPKQVVQSINKSNSEFQAILNEIQKIRYYQRFLSIEQFNDEAVSKFQKYFKTYKNIWLFRNEMDLYHQDFISQPWTSINVEDNKQKIDLYFDQALKFKKKIAVSNAQDEEFKIQHNDLDVLSFVFIQVKDMKPLIQTIQCLRDKSLTQKQFKQIKQYFQKADKTRVCETIDPQNKQATVKNLIEDKISEQLDFIQRIVFKSKKQMEINNKMIMVNKFWVQNNSTNAGRSLVQNFQKNYWDIITEIDQKITVINGINEDSQTQGQQLKQNISNNKSMFDTLRVLLVEWELHHRYLKYFEPIFMNSYWKTTKEMKIFSNAQNNWKKLIKQCKDYSLKRWATNQKAILTLRQNIIVFQELKKVVQDFLTAKREVFPKFYFISNQELLKILLEEKQFKSVQKYLNKIYTNLKALDLREDNSCPVGVTNLSSQYLSIRFTRMNNFQVQEMFKALDQSIKQSIRSSLRSCLNNFEKDEFNKKQWIKQNILQVLLFIQRSQFTKIMEFDYLCPDGQQLNQYLIYQNSQIKQLQTLIKQNSHQNGLELRKLETLLLQQFHTRDVIQMLKKNRIIDEESFQWQKQIRCYYNVDNAYTKYFVHDIDYGFEFVCSQNSFNYVSLCQRDVIQLANFIGSRFTPVIKGNNQLISNFCKFNGKNYINMYCSSKLSSKYLLNSCMGAFFSGTLLEMNQIQKLLPEQISVVCNFMKLIQASLSKKQKNISFGLKKLQINVNSGLIFKLGQFDSLKPQRFIQKISINCRQLSVPHISIGLYINLLLEAHKRTQDLFGQRVQKAVNLINELEQYQLIKFEKIRQICNLQQYKKQNNQKVLMTQKICQKISKTIISSKKIMFYQKLIRQIILLEESTDDSYSEQCNNLRMKQKNDFKFWTNHLLEITEKRQLCIVSGNVYSGKQEIIQQAYHQKISRESDVQIINLDIINDQNLLGCQLNDIWKEGILITKLRHLPFYKQEWIVFQSCMNQRVVDMIRKLSRMQIQLSNGEVIYLSQHWKFIFAIENVHESSLSIIKECEVISSPKYLTNEQTLFLLLQKRIKPYFTKNLQAYTLLSNMAINNFEKIMGLTKLIGIKNQFIKSQNIYRHLINILESVISKIKKQFVEHKEFIKGVQKIFIWSIYWSVGSVLPSINADKFEKNIFQTTKTQIERSQNLSLLRLEFDNPQGTLRKTKNQQAGQIQGQQYLVTLDLKSKTYFIENMIKSQFTVALVGPSGCGKTKYMSYIKNTLKQDQYAFLNINLTQGINLAQFQNLLYKKTRLSVKNYKKKCLCSMTNKRLIIMIDDFNLLEEESQVGQFLTSCIKYGYFYDFSTNEKTYLHNISFIVAQNNSFQFRFSNDLMKYLKPVYLNSIDLKEITQIYKPIFQELQILHGRYILDSTVSLHNFVINMQSNKQFTPYQFVSERSACNIINMIKNYKGQQNPAKIWAYCSQKEYITSGLCKQVQGKIKNQIQNLLNLIIQNCNQKVKPIADIQQLNEQLLQKSKFLKIDTNYEQYYEYVRFLSSAQKFNHSLITVNQPLPENMKKQLLQTIALSYSIKFHNPKSQKELKSFDSQKSIIYFSSSSQNFQQMFSYFINNRSKKFRYFIDICQINQFYSILKKHPSITTLNHIYIKPLQDNKQIFFKQYMEMFKKLSSYTLIQLSGLKIVQLSDSLLSIQKIVEKQISKKKEKAIKFIQRSSQIQKQSQQVAIAIEKMDIQVKQAHQSEQDKFVKKKQLNQKLVSLKNNKVDQDEEEKEKKIKETQEQIQKIQNQLKQLKNFKNKLLQKKSNQVTRLNLMKQITTKIANLIGQFKLQILEIQNLQKKKQSIIFLLNILNESLMSPSKSNYSTKLIQYVDVQFKQNEIDFSHLMKTLFNVNLNFQNKNLLLWLLNAKNTIVIDPKQDFVKAIRNHFPFVKIFKDFNCFMTEQRHQQPNIYIGQITKQEIFDVGQQNSIVVNDLQSIDKFSNKKIVFQAYKDNQIQINQMKNNLYEFFQPLKTKNIQNIKDDLSRIQYQNLQQKQKLIQIFIKNNQLSIKNLNDIKREINIQNSTKQRSLPLVKRYQETFTQRQDAVRSLIHISEVLKCFLNQVSALYSYFKVGQQNYLKMIKHCLSFKKQEVVQQNQKTQQNNSIKQIDAVITQQQYQKTQNAIKTNKTMKSTQKMQKKELINNENNPSQFSIQLTVECIINKILHKVLSGLKHKDSIFAFTLLAYHLAEDKLNVSQNYRKSLIKFIKSRSSVTKQEQQQLEKQLFQFGKIQQSQAVSFLELQKQIYSSRSEKQYSQELIEKLLKIGNNMLKFDYFTEIKDNRQFLQQTNQIVMVSNQCQNPYICLEQILINNGCTWSYFYQDLYDVQKAFQYSSAANSQKSQTHWAVFVDQIKESNLNTIMSIEKQNEKEWKVIYLYTSEQKLKLVQTYKKANITELPLVYLSKNEFIFQKIQSSYSQLIQPFTTKNLFSQVSRIVFYEQVNWTLKKHLDFCNKKRQVQQNEQQGLNYQKQYYGTKICYNNLSNLKNINLWDFIKNINQYVYKDRKDKQKIMLSQCKKLLSKKEEYSHIVNLINQQLLPVQDISFQGSNFVNQQNLQMSKIFNGENINKNYKEVITQFLPNAMKKKYPLDILFNMSKNEYPRQDCQQKPKTYKTVQINKATIFQKIQKFLNMLPVFSQLESLNNKKQKFIHKQLLKTQIKFRINKIKKLQEELKYIKALTESNQICSNFTTQKLFSIQVDELLRQNLSIEKFIKQNEDCIKYLDQLYQSKDNNKVIQPEFFINCSKFVIWLLYQTTKQSTISLGNSQIVYRYLNEKDKEAHFDVPEPCKGITISQIYLKNGKFDANKNLVEYSQKAQTGKISNIHGCLCQRDSFSMMPVLSIMQQQTIAGKLIINSKLKQQSVWKEKLGLQMKKTIS